MSCIRPISFKAAARASGGGRVQLAAGVVALLLVGVLSLPALWRGPCEVNHDAIAVDQLRVPVGGTSCIRSGWSSWKSMV